MRGGGEVGVVVCCLMCYGSFVVGRMVVWSGLASVVCVFRIGRAFWFFLG